MADSVIKSGEKLQIKIGEDGQVLKEKKDENSEEKPKTDSKKVKKSKKDENNRMEKDEL